MRSLVHFSPDKILVFTRGMDCSVALLYAAGFGWRDFNLLVHDLRMRTLSCRKKSSSKGATSQSILLWTPASFELWNECMPTHVMLTAAFVLLLLQLLSPILQYSHFNCPHVSYTDGSRSWVVYNLKKGSANSISELMTSKQILVALDLDHTLLQSVTVSSEKDQVSTIQKRRCDWFRLDCDYLCA